MGESRDLSAITYENASGWYLYIGQDGMFAASDIQLDVNIPVWDIPAWIFAPAHWPDGGACLEMVFAHTRTYADFSTRDEFWIYDHCGGGLVVRQNMNNPTWQDYYARLMGPSGARELVAYSEVILDGCWSAELYNFMFGVYDQVYSSCQFDNEVQAGWTIGNRSTVASKGPKHAPFNPRSSHRWSH